MYENIEGLCIAQIYVFFITFSTQKTLEHKAIAYLTRKVDLTLDYVSIQEV